jgi:hypothetical protein
MRRGGNGLIEYCFGWPLELERNQSPCILMNLVEGRHSLVLAST